MRLFEHDPYTGYERLQRSTSKYWETVEEAQAIWKAEGEEFDNLRAGIIGITDAVIIPWCNETDIARYERFLDITYENDKLPDLEFRRAMVAATLIGVHHIGRPEILGILTRFAPNQGNSVKFRNGHVIITVDGYIADEDAFVALLRKKLPAHLDLDVTVIIRREIRFDLPISLAAAVGSAVTGAPAVPNRRERLDLGSVTAGRINSAMAGDLANIPRSLINDLPVSSGGATGQKRSEDLIGAPRSSAINLAAVRRAELRSEQKGDLVDNAPHTGRLDHPVNVGGAVYQAGPPIEPAPPNKHITHFEAPPSGGAFLRSHITSQLIRTEEDDG